ncbi:MAG: hypothetical protein DRR08_29440 [Candidatus Parabeggiatoa sp. nov. 2]|nr:MAG: hypothetical protein B6247_13575 [Beggiatoa sp. 4572_84]RKZ51304.1 MAG: hypothetical protein DRR08_29440 [Gammaproteobacteria bacterium]
MKFDWITNTVFNLRTLFQNDPNVFVAGDLLWYPVEGDNKICKAPDVMVAFGRPKHHRGSYQQWLEDNIAPQVVFEIRSPSNKDAEMETKFRFYQDYQVEEYYLYDPNKGQLKGWLRGTDQLHSIVPMHKWKSPRLGIRFEQVEKELYLYYPDGRRFTTHEEEAKRAETEAKRAETEAKRAEAEAKRAEAAEAKLNRLKTLLEQQGISLNDDIFANDK